MSLNETIILSGVYDATTAGWVSEPSFRGTFSILISCLSTLILSTWSVMHLNVPKKHGTAAGYIKRYFVWGFIGVFGPELAIWCAWRQFLSAKALRDEILHLQAENDDLRAKALQPWTLTHGFYAAMGGFVVELESEPLNDHRPWIEDVSRLTLTPKGVRLLAECGYLPDLTSEEIDDKSKTDELGKVLACLQAVWMIIQVCCRIYLKLPVTLLEVTTIGHVVCALVLYSLWWYKPRWIQEPTKIEGQWLRPICAFMFMASQMSSTTLDRSGFSAKFNVSGSEISNLFFLKGECPRTAQQEEGILRDYATTEATNHPDVDTLRDAQSTPPYGAFIVREDSKPAIDGFAGYDEEQAATPDDAVSTRHTLAVEAIATYPAIRRLLHPKRSPKERRHHDAIKIYPEMPYAFRNHRQQIGKPSNSATTSPYLACDTEHLVNFAASDWPSDGLLRTMDRKVDRPANSAFSTSSGLVIGGFLWLASIAFAGVHVAAWSDSYPTALEAWTWRASSIFICFSGIVWLLISMLAQYSKHVWWLWFDLLSGDAPKWCRSIVVILCTLCGLCYVFSRIFLIVEAFISLRKLPIASFQVPKWTVSVPHL